MPEPLTLTIADHVAEIRLEQPPVNILTIDLLRRLDGLIDRIEASPVRSVLLYGAGKCFSAGADVREHLPGTVEKMIPQFGRTLRRLLEIEIPTTAWVHGVALGGGLELALACDFIVADESAAFGLPEISLGLFPPVAAAMLPMLIGQRHAMEMICSGEKITRRTAYEIGLINRFGDIEEARTFAHKFAGHPRVALAAGKKATRTDLVARLEAAERIYLDELMKHPEPLEGLNAFLAKRPPSWKRPAEAPKPCAVAAGPAKGKSIG